MIQQLLRLCVVWRQFQGFFGLGSRQFRFLLLQIDFRQHRPHFRGVPRLQRSLQFLHGIIHLALMAIDFSQAVVGRRVRWIGRKNSAKLFFRCFHMPGRKFLPPSANARRRCVARNGGSRGAGRSFSRLSLRAKPGDIKLHFDAREPRRRFVLLIQRNRRKTVWPERFFGFLAFLIRLRFFPRFFQRQYQQRAVLRIIRFALRRITKIVGCHSRIIALQCQQAQIKGIVVFPGGQFGRAPKIRLRRGGLALPGTRDSQII